MCRHFYCVHGDSQTQTTTQIHTTYIYIYSVFIYIQCKQWLNISLWLPGVHRMNDFPPVPDGLEDQETRWGQRNPKQMCGKRWDAIMFIHVFYFFLSLFGVFFLFVAGVYQSVSPILTDSAVMGWPSRDSSLVMGWTYCGWLRNPAPGRATIEIRDHKGMFIIY